MPRRTIDRFDAVILGGAVYDGSGAPGAVADQLHRPVFLPGTSAQRACRVNAAPRPPGDGSPPDASTISCEEGGASPPHSGRRYPRQLEEVRRNLRRGRGPGPGILIASPKWDAITAT
jgi:hypothetical protein